MMAFPCSRKASLNGASPIPDSRSRRPRIGRSPSLTESPPPIVFSTPDGMMRLETDTTHGVVALPTKPPEIRAESGQD